MQSVCLVLACREEDKVTVGVWYKYARLSIIYDDGPVCCFGEVNGPLVTYVVWGWVVVFEP